jgi:uncharacterized protein with von Willebrand factor type A (vWA) domain
MLYRYSRWDGTQNIAAFTAEDLLNAMADDLIGDGDVESALQRIFRNGVDGQDGRMRGLQDLLNRLRERKQQELNRYRLDSLMDDLKKRLDDLIKTEREGIQRKLDQAAPNASQPSSDPRASQPPTDSAAPSQSGERSDQSANPQSGQQSSPSQSQQSSGEQSSGQSGQQSSGDSGMNQNEMAGLRRMLESLAKRKLQYLDELPPDFGGAVKSLTEYEFMDPDAQRQFQELLKMLEQQILGNRFEGLKQQLQSMTPQDLQRMREMIRDLNQMLQEKMRGGNPDFQSFMDKHGSFFGPDIQSLDDLMEHLQRSMAQMQSMLDSMSPEMRQQLQSLMDELLRDDRLRWDMAQLAANLERLMPSRQFRNRYPFRGDESLTFEEAMELMQDLQDLDQLERQLKRAGNPRDVDNIDPDEVSRLLGPEARQELDQLQQILQVLEDAGYIQKTNRGYELSARGMRKIGQKALQDIFGKLKRDAFGKHPIANNGGGGERLDDSKPYAFGDAFHLDLERTLMNSIVREGVGTPVQLKPDDFAVYRTELTTTSATVLMVDMSRSMILRGCFQAAKKSRGGAGQPDSRAVPERQSLLRHLLGLRARAQAGATAKDRLG